MNYEKKYKEAFSVASIEYKDEDRHLKASLERIFPELAKTEDDRIREKIIALVNAHGQGGFKESMLAWLEKQKNLTDEEYEQGKKDVLWCINKAAQNAKDENEMGACWFAEKWLEKQKPKPIKWSEEDTFKVQRICKYLVEAKKYYADITKVRDCIDWLKSFKERIGG